ncbi:TetR family transcriptional regulator [Bradymonas sediminis]|nr:TetR family transcriptional regulator [Bradymonas sediminis]
MTHAQKKRSDKRKRILDGALKAFALKGFYNTKVSEIAQEAGVADGTIYLYFKNKDDLLISLFEDRMEWIIERLTADLKKFGDDVLAKFRHMVMIHCRLAVEEPKLAEFITIELRQSSKFVKEYKNPKFGDYLKIFQTLIEDGQASGIFRRDVDPRLISRACFGALDEVLLQLTLSKADAAEVEDKASQVASVLVAGLLERPASSAD